MVIRVWSRPDLGRISAPTPLQRKQYSEDNNDGESVNNAVNPNHPAMFLDCLLRVEHRNALDRHPQVFSVA